MRKIYTLLFLILLVSKGEAQDLTGQWKGVFTSQQRSFFGMTTERDEYVLELEFAGKNVSGFSYTYTYIDGKKYYSICLVKGTFDKADKSIVVNEYKTSKSNMPEDYPMGYQTHRLRYERSGKEDLLVGRWGPSPAQPAAQGFGETKLSRRNLSDYYAIKTSPTQEKSKVVSSTDVASVPKRRPEKSTESTAKTTIKIEKAEPQMKSVEEPVKTEIAKTDTVTVAAPGREGANNVIANTPRESNIIKTIEVESKKLKIDLYDNGDIDGDSVSVYFNNKLILSKQRLTDKALTLTIDVNDAKKINELVMYAENLGTIPPNTALMVVTDGPNRYEVRITSDLKRSGAIRFVHHAQAEKKP